MIQSAMAATDDMANAANATGGDSASAPLMLSQMIDRLSPVPEPPLVAWWPQTWGWLVLGGVVVALLAWLGWRRYRYWKANRYRREALAELHRRLAEGDGAVALAEIVRRTALAAFPRQQVASLRGESWCRFLNRSVAPGRSCFDAASAERLSTLPYRQSDEAGRDLDDLTRRVERWIRSHEAQRGAVHD